MSFPLKNVISIILFVTSSKKNYISSCVNYHILIMRIIILTNLYILYYQYINEIKNSQTTVDLSRANYPGNCGIIQWLVSLIGNLWRFHKYSLILINEYTLKVRNIGCLKPTGIRWIYCVINYSMIYLSIKYSTKYAHIDYNIIDVFQITKISYALY